MALLSKETEYGLLFLIHLKKHSKEIVSLKNFSLKTGISFLFMQKIAKKLKKANFVKSERGIKGGYSLAGPVKKISISKLIKALEGEGAFEVCDNKDKCCPLEPKCIYKNNFSDLYKKIDKFLDSVNLTNL